MMPEPGRRLTIMTVFGTRPEVIKLAPVVRQFDFRPEFRTVNVSSGQHGDLLAPFVAAFDLHVDHDLAAMRPGQPLNLLLSRIIGALDPIIAKESPDLVVVQGDTTTALAAALTAFNRRVPVAHVEAGLRTPDLHNPFPEEANRRLITRLARLHFAATKRNIAALLAEGVPADWVRRTGNPVVDALLHIGTTLTPSDKLLAVLDATKGTRRLVLTTHRRESFGTVLQGNLRAVRDFVARRADVSLIFPVHPNPQVHELAHALLGGRDRVHLVEPLDYADFIHLLSEAWLIASDSGGVQEEAPSLNKPLLILRESTERPEVLDTPLAKLAPTPEALATLLAEEYSRPERRGEAADNPFGKGDAAVRIAEAVAEHFGLPVEADLSPSHYGL